MTTILEKSELLRFSENKLKTQSSSGRLRYLEFSDSCESGATQQHSSAAHVCVVFFFVILQSMWDLTPIVRSAIHFVYLDTSIDCIGCLIGGRKLRFIHQSLIIYR